MPLRLCALPCLALSLAASRAAAAPGDSAWIEVSANESCDVSRERLSESIQAAVIGARDERLRCAISIESDAGEYVVTVRVFRGESELGDKTIRATTCREVEDAAAVVVSLAIGIPREETGGLGDGDVLGGSPATVPKDEQQVRIRPQATAPVMEASQRDSGVTDERKSPRRHEGFRATALAGLDAFTLAEHAPYVGFGASRTLSVFEVRAIARYGLPHVTEEETSRIVRTRAEFATLDALICYTTRSAVQVGACAGPQLGFKREMQHVIEEGPFETRTNVSDALLGATLAAVAAYRGSMVQPELELATTARFVGVSAESPVAALRAGAGVSVQF